DTDTYGIPVRPTWSVNKLLSSYPQPKLSPQIIQRLYELSALVCPKMDTSDFKVVQEDLEEMIRMVEAVRLVDTSGVSVKGRGEKEDVDGQAIYSEPRGEFGQGLLEHASRTQDQFYIVDSDRRR
ncbi:hypothetical protein BDN70DRAFT_778229, partial [Pholiota conissans]